MAKQANLLLGFDPGGKTERKFGWSVCHLQTLGVPPQVVETGVGVDAWDVFEAVSKVVRERFEFSSIVAAGVDAPLFWGKRGDRNVDRFIRSALVKGRKVSVMAVNSLASSVTVQGVLLAKYLWEEFADIQITETHPSALVSLLKAGDPQGSVSLDRMTSGIANEHKRDATISAFAAWQMLRKPKGWIDLYPMEPSPVQPFSIPVQYWMPLG